MGERERMKKTYFHFPSDIARVSKLLSWKKGSITFTRRRARKHLKSFESVQSTDKHMGQKWGCQKSCGVFWVGSRYTTFWLAIGDSSDNGRVKKILTVCSTVYVLLSHDRGLAKLRFYRLALQFGKLAIKTHMKKGDKTKKSFHLSYKIL